MTTWAARCGHVRRVSEVKLLTLHGHDRRREIQTTDLTIGGSQPLSNQLEQRAPDAFGEGGVDFPDLSY